MATSTEIDGTDEDGAGRRSSTAATPSTASSGVDDPPPRPSIGTSVTGWFYRHRSWVEPIVVFLAIRAVGILVLARFTQLRDTTLGNALGLWDGKWMLAIAEYGYRDVPYTQTDARGLHTIDTAYAFFPGYPYLVGTLARLPLLTPFGSAILVNLVLGCLAAVGAARLAGFCAKTMGDRSPIGSSSPRRVGLLAAALFAATPMSVVLNMAYTEALFCALAVWALIGVVEHRWILAGICASLAGLTRPTAAVVIGVVILAALIARKDGPRAWAAVVISPLGYLGYLAVVWAHTGSPTGWFRIQTEGWGTEFDWGVATVNFVNDVLVNSGEVAPVATAWIILATLLLLGVAVWSRLPWPILLYGALVVASIVLSSGLMMSRARLLLPAFVLLIPIAMLLARLRTGPMLALLIPIVIGSSWFGAHMITVYPHAM
ncbi:mannosyltransferase family protein [Gordonia soli]|uniref:mannosyltransferase family protein n=1 Tax=Gordonia soli TaxID=320799 RepID=UPI00059117D8